MSAVALMVAEKPSVAELIAQKLSTNGFKSRKSMFLIQKNFCFDNLVAVWCFHGTYLYLSCY